MIRYAFLASPLLALAACAEAPPRADPADVARLLARIEANSPDLPAHLRQKAAEADRLAAPLAKLDADSIDPGLAEAVIAR